MSTNKTVLKLRPLAVAVSTTFAVSLTAGSLVGATENPFRLNELQGGYMVAAEEGVLGGAANAVKDKAISGATDAAKAQIKKTANEMLNGKPAAGDATITDTAPDAASGDAATAKKAEGSGAKMKKEGQCGAEHMKKMEGKCGEGKCGANKSKKRMQTHTKMTKEKAH